MTDFKEWDEQIYEAYPRKVGKRAALKAINYARVRLHDGEFKSGNKYDWSACQEFLLTKTRQFSQSPAGNRETLTPHPSTFYNQSRYLDAEVEWYRMTPDEMKQNARQREANVGV